MRIDYLIEPKLREQEMEIKMLRNEISKFRNTEDLSTSMMRFSMEKAEAQHQQAGQPAVAQVDTQVIKRPTGYYNVVVQITRIA